jgi:hypothetical protein
LPRASNIPKGVIATSSVSAQLLGILYIAYGIVCNDLSRQNALIYTFILVVLPIGILLFCWLLYKRYQFPVTNTENDN